MFLSRLTPGSVDVERINPLFDELEEEGREELAGEGMAAEDISVVHTMDIRYVDQIWEVTVNVPLGEIDEAALEAIRRSFDDRHKELYTFSEAENIAEVVNMGVTV